MTKREEYITLSEKYGVNPSITHCFICGKEDGIALMGKLEGDKEAPQHYCDPSIVCDECKEQLDRGNKFVLEVTDSSSEENIVRTWSYVCLKSTALPEMKSQISYCSHTTFQKMFGEFINK